METERSTRSWACLYLVTCSLCLGYGSATAQPYPVKPIRLIVPLAPGGPSDILARTMAQKMGESMKQSIVVDNRTGAGGTIGTDIAAKAPADGYNLLLIAVATYTINANLYKKLPFDPRKDLVPVSVLAAAPYVLTVHPSLPAKSMKDLIALAKSRSRDLNYASGGTGTGPQLAFELVMQQTGMKITHIPYKGTGPALNDMISGQVQVALFNMIAAMPVVNSGRLRAIAVSGAKRYAKLPDLPTFAELGIKGFEVPTGHMIMAPAATPRDIIVKLHQEAVKAVQSPDVKARLEAEGAEIVGNTPDQAAAIIRTELEKWANVIAKAGITLN
jgi:tripartite-type tricarboxylate transporter receptor subunit TctC